MSHSVSDPTTDGVPAPVLPVVELMSSFPAHWALCGGWAVDAWLGRKTRDHADIDISVFVQHQQVLFEHLQGWQLLAHGPDAPGGDNDEWWDGRRQLKYPAHIHARPPERSGPMPERGIATAEDGFTLDIQLDDHAGDEWALLREPRISMPIRDAVRASPWGLPTAVPEVLLFFKARDLRRRDKLDFLALLPQLTREQRAWLRSAIERAGHPWLPELSS